MIYQPDYLDDPFEQMLHLDTNVHVLYSHVYDHNRMHLVILLTNHETLATKNLTYIQIYKLRKRKSIEAIAGNKTITAIVVNVIKMAVCKQKQRNAGIGIIAAEQNATILPIDDNRILKPASYLMRNILSILKPDANNGTICVVVALNERPINAQTPRPEATAKPINKTPNIPSIDCDLSKRICLLRHLDNDKPACNNINI
ncbi:hypothetical protein DERP_004089 [Dermatophagoides pteronyssinus]|uniref:Uncharacterized protein n=1 Tax=Dermatophagoides pteronyssinus TaxID=6956 RepID=A0ABQ8J847_DERPT|nr:hypothetical protein DERP_004089 [Dermatophagoides pteronyssinus]